MDSRRGGFFHIVMHKFSLTLFYYKPTDYATKKRDKIVGYGDLSSNYCPEYWSVLRGNSAEFGRLGAHELAHKKLYLS